MAFTDNTTYTGKDAQGFYAKALLTGETKKLIKPYTNVKSKLKIARYDEANVLQADDCVFADGGTGTLSQKTITVCPIKVNKEYCVGTFEANYLSEQLRAGANGEEVMPMSIEEFMLEQIAKNVSKDLESLLWNGDVDGSPETFLNLCDGFLKKFVADGTVVDVSGTTLTTSNVITEMKKVYAAIPSTIINDPELVIFVNHATYKLLKQAYADVATANGAYYNQPLENLTFLGIPVVVAPGLPNNNIVAACKYNLWFGTDLMSDFDDILIVPMKKTAATPTVRFAARFQFGVEYGVGEEVVYYRP